MITSQSRHVLSMCVCGIFASCDCRCSTLILWSWHISVYDSYSDEVEISVDELGSDTSTRNYRLTFHIEAV